MSEPTFDIVEDILVRLHGEDLLRCKSVCKSWLSFISNSRFINTHLEYNKNKDLNNPELGPPRIIIPGHSNTIDDGNVLPHTEYWFDVWCIVGSCNGLVCFSTSVDNAQLIISNPLTREVKKLPTAPEVPEIPVIPKATGRRYLCWGFGYDSLTDDYKVVMGTMIEGKTETLFQVLTLKSNLWKVTGQVNWHRLFHPFGILWKGALHWFMEDCNHRRVIISFDLSREEFKEIPQPDDSRYVCDFSNYLGSADGCLCIYRNQPPYQRWVMKSNYDKQSWELLRDDCEKNTYDIAHALKDYKCNNWYLSCNEDDKFVSKIGKYISCPIYVPSLVSPHLNGKEQVIDATVDFNEPKKKSQTKNNKQTDKAGYNNLITKERRTNNFKRLMGHISACLGGGSRIST